MQENKVFIVFFLLLFLIFFSCQRNGNYEKIILENEVNKLNNDSVEFVYTRINDSVLSVRRVYYINKFKPLVLNYNLKKSHNHVDIGFLDINGVLSYHEYLSFDSAKTQLVDFVTVKYANSRMKYVGVFLFRKNNKEYKFHKFVGNDVGPKCHDTTFYYFDLTNHLQIIECDGLRLVSTKIN